MVMDTFDDDARESEMDRGIARRLAKLRTMPVDTSRLDGLLAAQLPQAPRVQGNAPVALWRLRPLRAIAAGVAILAVIGAILLTSSGGPVLAAPAHMAQVQEGILSCCKAVK